MKKFTNILSAFSRMIKNIDVIEEKLSNFVDMLVGTNAEDRIDDLIECKKILPVSPKQTAASILSMYGAAGSINDIVLYENGQLLLKENSDLDDLRSDLYDDCKALLD